MGIALAAFEDATLPLLIGGEERAGGEAFDVRSPWDASIVARAAVAKREDVVDAVTAAERARSAALSLGRAERAGVLERMAGVVEHDADGLAQILVAETGKTIRDCRSEVARAISTLQVCAGVACELVGEQLPLDAVSGVDDRLAYTVPEPMGVVAGVPAVNFPLLIGVHKVGPAIAAGCPIVVKAPDRAPLAVHALARVAVQSGWPASAIGVVMGEKDVGIALTTDARVRVISFTGSSTAGHAIARQSGTAELLLELGSNAAAVVSHDADVDLVVDRCALGGYSANGQSCISVQRLFVARERYDEVVANLAQRVSALRAGDPSDERTDVGPVIDDAGVERILGLVDDAEAHGAELLVGGGHRGRLVEPTLLAGLDDRMRLNHEEVFGPVIAIGTFADLDEAVRLVNASPYGLQAGVFTVSIDTALDLAERLDVGGVHVNEVPTFRADHMPYGGVKDSGMGKEGPRYAVRRMTHFKVVSVQSAGARRDGRGSR